MGLTLHYKGELNDINQVHKLKDELIDIAETMNWKWDSLDGDWKKLPTAELIQHEEGIRIAGHLPLKGMSFTPHPDCEPVSFYFDSLGRLGTPISMVLINEGRLKDEAPWISVKTQFASAKVHITIVKLLKYIKEKYITNLQVDDEGSYWETGDENILKEKMDFITQKLDMLESALSNLHVEGKDFTEEDIVKAIEKILKRLK